MQTTRFAKVNTALYQIDHDLDSSGHSITIRLNYKRENLYLKLLKEKALLRGRISLMESIGDEMDDEVIEVIERIVKWGEAI